MSENKALRLLGIAQKARAVVSGSFGVERAVRAGTAKLVIVAKDASENTRKDLSHITYHYGVPMLTASTREQLGRAVGQPERVTLAVTDEGLAGRIREEFGETDDRTAE